MRSKRHRPKRGAVITKEASRQACLAFLDADATGVALLKCKFTPFERMQILTELARESESEAVVISALKEIDRVVERNMRLNGYIATQTLTATSETEQGHLLVQERREALVLHNALTQEIPNGNIDNPLARVIKPIQTR